MSHVDTGRRWVELMDIDQLPGARLNPRRHNIPELRASIARFGYVDPMVLDERTGQLVAGHGRRDTLRGLRDSGEPPPPGVVIGERGEWQAYVLRGWASANDVEAAGYLLTSNRQTELASWDLDGLVDLLGLQDDFTGLGWTPEEIDRLLDGPDPSGAGDSDTGQDDADDQPAPTPGVQYGVLVICADEAEQAAVQDQLSGEGYDCRPISR
ncbi:ParB/RepB/Spo0J family partition protein [Micromonospora sp. NPDC006766]|uniref:ParB/RepB/Spo0J family partition protein n=1 Tax=Micromonospora sp. NPDC006766 TaxID=3154778 RepID=UPI0033ED066D